ncbi:MAG: alpha/beta hydrolase [Chlamydiota bacterium]
MAVETIESPFVAHWNPTNQHLKDPVPNFVQRIVRIVWNIFSVLIFPIGLIRLAAYGIGRLAAAVILPSRLMPDWLIKQFNEKFHNFWFDPIQPNNPDQVALRNHFTASKHSILTPDGALLSANLFRHRDANAMTPTLICFQPNAGSSAQDGYRWLLKDAIAKGTPFNFVTFDYRSVGNSKGSFRSTKDLIVDGTSILQWVRQTLHTPDDQIHFYGLSLGGAYATKTMATDPEKLIGRLANIKSLASLDEVLCGFLPLSLEPLARFVCKILKTQGYELNAVADFNKLQGQKLVVYHPEDPVIPWKASLQQSVNHPNFLKLTLDPDDIDAAIEIARYNHHNAPLEYYGNAKSQVTDFIFNRPAAQQEDAG